MPPRQPVCGSSAPARSDFPQPGQQSFWRSRASSRAHFPSGARDINPQMKMAAAKSIAGLIPENELNEENILPGL